MSVFFLPHHTCPLVTDTQQVTKPSSHYSWKGSPVPFKEDQFSPAKGSFLMTQSLNICVEMMMASHFSETWSDLEEQVAVMGEKENSGRRLLYFLRFPESACQGVHPATAGSAEPHPPSGVSHFPVMGCLQERTHHSQTRFWGGNLRSIVFRKCISRISTCPYWLVFLSKNALGYDSTITTC